MYEPKSESSKKKSGRPRARIELPCSGCGTPIERYLKQVEQSKTGQFFCDSCGLTAARKPSTKVIVKCALPECTVLFEKIPSSKRQYCSTAHSTLARWQRAGSRPQTRQCALSGCMELFEVVPSDPKRFCSPDHASSSRVTKERRLCPGCNEWFEDTPSRIGEYHNRACRNAHIRIECICRWCGEAFTRNASQMKNGGGKYCCPAHHQAGRRTNAIDRWHNGKPVVKMFSKSKNSKRTYLKLWQPDHPRAHVTGWVMEHVYEACLKYGYVIPLEEHVHHVDRNGENNAWENLVVLSEEEHARLTAMENAGRAAAADGYLLELATFKADWSDPVALRTRLAELESGT